jgi:hypothetical protein
MKKETQQLHGNIGNYGGGVFASERKWAWGPKMASKHLPRRKKTTGGLENGLENPWKRKNITKKAHADRGLETIWEMSVYIQFPKKLRNLSSPFPKYGMEEPIVGTVWTY